MRIHVDQEKCQGHNRCAVVAAALIEIDDFGMASAAGDGVVPVPQQRAAHLAADNCPEFAVVVTED